MPIIEDITEDEERQSTPAFKAAEDLHNDLQDRPPEGSVREEKNKFPVEDEGGVESDSEDFFDASDLTTVQQWQLISVRFSYKCNARRSVYGRSVELTLRIRKKMSRILLL